MNIHGIKSFLKEWWFLIVPVIVISFLYFVVLKTSDLGALTAVWDNASSDGKLIFLGLVFVGFFGGR